MGWSPSRPPAKFCALDFDMLIRQTADRPPRKFAVLTKQLRHDRRRRYRYSAGCRGQFVLPRKDCVCFGFVRPADFFANCPLFCRKICCANNTLFPRRFCTLTERRMRLRRHLPLELSASLLARGLTARFFSRIALCAYLALSAAWHSPMHANNYEL